MNNRTEKLSHVRYNKAGFWQMTSDKLNKRLEIMSSYFEPDPGVNGFVQNVLMQHRAELPRLLDTDQINRQHQTTNRKQETTNNQQQTKLQILGVPQN